MIALSSIDEAVVFPFRLTRGGWTRFFASGFDMELLDNGNLGHESFNQGTNELLSLAAQSPAAGHRGTPERPGRYADVQSERQRRES
ncbi:hypothetical protein ACNKHP_11870 [Shigella boydii]